MPSEYQMILAYAGKMQMYIFLAILVQCALGVPFGAFHVNLGSDAVSPRPTTGCCNCKFEDTMYMKTACGGMTAFMTLVQNVMMARCDIADPCRRLGSDEVPPEEQWYDFIVVGAGIAGPVIARRLSDHPWWKVLLIEAGPEEPTMTAIPGLAFNTVNSSLDWNFETEPTEPQPTACLATGGRCKWPRGKMMGGTGAMHGMMYVRGHPEIYNKWARAGNEGWSYNDIRHYFERAENPVDPTILSDQPRRVENGGPIKIQYFNQKPEFADDLLEAAGHLGYRTSRLKEYSQTGFMVAPMTTEDGVRLTTSRAYLRPVHERTNLRVLTNAQVTRVLINEWNNMANGVELVDRQGIKRVVKCNKEVILTAGAVGSPHILLNSGIGPSEDLSQLGIRVYKDLPVGKNLHNHVSVAVPMSIEDMPYETMTMESVNEYLETKSGPLASTGLTQVTAFMESSFAADGVSDIQVFFDGFSSTCPKTGLPFECKNGNLKDCEKRRDIVARPTVLIADSRGYMKLRSNNPLDRPLLYPNYFTAQKDMTVLLESIKKVTKLLDTPTMRKWDLRMEPKTHPNCAEFHYGSDAYWECMIRTETGPENHQAGTCKMGPQGDATAVVDPQLRVHGVPNIRVADASIFPIVPNSNPIAGILMVAEKAADMIQNSWPE